MPMLQDPCRRSERLLVIITDMKDTVSTIVVMADAISRCGACVFRKAVQPACMIYKRIRRVMRHIFYEFLCKCDLFTSRFKVPRLTEQTIIKNRDTLKLFRDEYWRDLSEEDKISVLECVADIERSYLGVPYELFERWVVLDYEEMVIFRNRYDYVIC